MKASLLVLGLAVAGISTHPMADLVWPRAVMAWSPPLFQDYGHFFRYIAASHRPDGMVEAGLDEAALARQLAAQSTIEHVLDCPAAPIAVVRAELLNRDGTSRLRSPAGNYLLYVLRETPQGLLLLGRMYGRSYRSKIVGQRLEFDVQREPSGRSEMQQRFRIEGDTLIDLSAARQRFQDAMI